MRLLLPLLTERRAICAGVAGTVMCAMSPLRNILAYVRLVPINCEATETVTGRQPVCMPFVASNEQWLFLQCDSLCESLQAVACIQRCCLVQLQLSSISCRLLLCSA